MFKIIRITLVCLAIGATSLSGYKNETCGLPGIHGIPVLDEPLPATDAEVQALIKEKFGRVIGVIFKGAITKDWSVSKYTFDYLKQNFGHELQDINFPDYNEYLREGFAASEKYGSLKLSDYIDDCLNGTEYGYLSHWTHPQITRESLDSENFFPTFGFDNELRRCKYDFFIGGDSIHSGMHNHGATYFAVLDGKKKIYLADCDPYPEALLAEMQKNASENQFIRSCPCPAFSDEGEIDGTYYHNWYLKTGNSGHKGEFLQEYVELLQDTIYEGVLEAGDLVYIPDNVFHNVIGEGASVSMFYRDEGEYKE